MRNRLLLALFLTTSLTAPAAAEKWHTLDSDDTEIDYFDSDSIKRVDNQVSVDLLRSFAGGSGNDANIFFLKHSLDLACDRREFRDTALIAYNLDRQYVTAPAFERGWVKITPTSTLDKLRGFACDNGGEFNVVDDPFEDADLYWGYMYYYGY